MSGATGPSSRHALTPLRVNAVEPLTDESVTISFEVPDELGEYFRFKPGQHVALVREGADDQLRRSYSICSPCGEALRVAVKRLPEGRFSAYVHEQLTAGDTLLVLPPTGRFTTAFDPARARHYGAIAAGSGIAPVISIIASALAIEPGSRCTLIYGNRTTSSIMFLEELEDLKNRYPTRLQLIHVLSREPQDVELSQGRIDRPKLERMLATLLDPGDVDEWFLCGPLALVEEARSTLLDAGVSGGKIHRELFHTDDIAPAPRRASDQFRDDDGDGARVMVSLDGRRTTLLVPHDGVSILDALLAHRADAPFACKGGVCGSCRCRVLDGQVRMDHAYALEEDELREGFALACQSHPVTDTVVLDFDR